MLNSRFFYGSLFFLSSLFFGSCTEDVEPVCDELPASFMPTDFQALFLELAFGQEFGKASNRLRKWNMPIKIFIEGNPTANILDEVDLVISELYDLSTKIVISKVADKAQANLILFFGAKEDYVDLIEPKAAGIAEGNSGFATIAWNNNNEIFRASACVDIVNFDGEDFIRHVVREELAQTLGLINDSETEENSIFYQFTNDVTAYSETDKALIAFMLGVDLLPGMCQAEVMDVVE